MTDKRFFSDGVVLRGLPKFGRIAASFGFNQDLINNK